jgi:hypothetical protein
MAYVAQADLAGLIPATDITEALDDDNDGVADAAAWAQVLALVSSEIDQALVSGGYDAPYPEPYPARILAVNELWLRRGVADHPRKNEVIAVRNDLTRLAKGTIKLVATTATTEGGSAITEDGQLYNEDGNLLVSVLPPIFVAAALHFFPGV